MPDTPFGIPPKRGEIGGSGTTIYNGYLSDIDYNTAFQTIRTLVETYDEMRKGDAQVQATLQAVKLPIIQANWHIVPASENPADIEVADFISKAVFELQRTTFEERLWQILTMLDFGHSVAEKVYQMVDGKVVWLDWAPRLQKSIEKFEMENGKDGITQRFYNKEGYETVSIPRQKLMYFVHHKEGDNHMGVSALRSAYQHWFIKKTLYKIEAIAFERQALGIPIITLPPSHSDGDKSLAEELAENIRANEKAYIILPNEQWKFEIADMKANGLKDPTDAIAHHDRKIATSMLAHFIDLGSNATGSRALSEDQSEFFLLGVRAVAREVAEVINRSIRELVDYNFEVEEYPYIDFSDIGKKDISKLSESIKKLAEAGFISAAQKDENQLRGMLDLPELSADELAEREEEKELMKKRMMGDGMQDDSSGKKDEKQKPTDSDGKKGDMEEEKEDASVKANEKKNIKLSESGFYREFTLSEEKVNFPSINQVMDDAEEEFKKYFEEVILIRKDRLKTDLDRVLKRKKKISEIVLYKKNELKRDFLTQATAVYEKSQKLVIQEMGVKPPTKSRALFTLPSNDKEELKIQIEQGVDILEQDMIKVCGGVIIEEKQRGSDNDVAIGEALTAFEQKMAIAATLFSSLIVSRSFNTARDTVFDQNTDKIQAMQFSALLDGSTCYTCLSLDGRTVKYGSREYRALTVPVHYNCRCIWVEVLTSEPSVEISGVPPEFLGQRPSNFRNIRPTEAKPFTKEAKDIIRILK